MKVPGGVDATESVQPLPIAVCAVPGGAVEMLTAGVVVLVAAGAAVGVVVAAGAAVVVVVGRPGPPW